MTALIPYGTYLHKNPSVIYASRQSHASVALQERSYACSGTMGTYDDTGDGRVVEDDGSARNVVGAREGKPPLLDRLSWPGRLGRGPNGVADGHHHQQGDGGENPG